MHLSDAMKPMTQKLFFLALPALAVSEAHASSLPQMDTTWYANQLLWLAISFLTLYVCVSRFIAPTIASILATRESAINDAIREAEAARQQAESTRGTSASATQSARVQAAELIAKAQAKISAEAADALAKLDRDLERRTAGAAAVLEEAVVKANAGIEAAANSLAEAITQKLLSAGDAAQAVDGPKLKLAKR